MYGPEVDVLDKDIFLSLLFYTEGAKTQPNCSINKLTSFIDF